MCLTHQTPHSLESHCLWSFIGNKPRPAAKGKCSNYSSVATLSRSFSSSRKSVGDESREGRVGYATTFTVRVKPLTVTQSPRTPIGPNQIIGRPEASKSLAPSDRNKGEILLPAPCPTRHHFSLSKRHA